MKRLSKACENAAATRGYIELYDGARRHWSDWVPPVAWEEGAGPCSRDEAVRRINDPEHPWFGKTNLHRVDTHKAMNALIQGSAARHTKLWMRACWREGVVPLLQLHDCLDCSVVSPEQAERVAQLAREVVTLEVPIQVDLAYGRNWADATHKWVELANGHTVHVDTPTAPISLPAEPKPKEALMRSFDSYSSGERPWGHNLTEYVYRDKDGTPYLKTVRTSAKQFPQFHWENGRWVKGKPAGPKIPYRLPELIAAAPDVPVFASEGEKDADNVAALGLITTTNSEGAGKGKWTTELNRWFAGKQTVYILADNDDHGRRHAREVAAALYGTVPEVRIVEFPELPAKGDVSDWIEAGGTTAQLLARAKAAPKFEPPKWRLRFHGEANPVESRPWLVELLIPETGTGLISGQWGVFKSFCALDLAAAVMAGGKFIKFPAMRRGGVLFIAMEGETEIALRVEAAVRARGLTGNAPFAWITECPRLLDQDAAQALTAMAQQAAERMQQDFGLPLALVIIDTMGKAAGYQKTGDEDDAVIATKIESVLSAVSRATGAFVLGLDHFGKDPTTGTRGSSGKEGHTDVVLALLGDRAQSGTVTCTRLCARKRRSGPNGEEFPFRTRVVDMGTDEKGTPVTTLVIDWTVNPAENDKTATPAKDNWSKSLRLLRHCLMAKLADCGSEQQPYGLEGLSVRAVDLELIRSEFYASCPADGTPKQKADARRQAFTRALKDAQAKGLIGVREIGATTFIWLEAPTENA